MRLYRQLAKFYDVLYSDKDYKKIANFIKEVWQKYCKSQGKDLLDVACGTGTLIMELQKLGFNAFGLDLNKEMINIARKKVKTKLWI